MFANRLVISMCALVFTMFILWGLFTFAGFAFIFTDCIFSQILLFESKVTEVRGVERITDMRHISVYNYAFW